MSRRGWLAGVLIVTVLLGTTALGLLYLRSQRARAQIRAYLETTLSKELEMPVKLGSVGFSLGLGRVEVGQAALLDPETRAPLLEVGRVQVGLRLWPLLWREVRVRSVSVGQPKLFLEDSPRQRELVLGLLARLGELARPGGDARFPVLVDGGVVHYARPGSGFAVEIVGLRVALEWQASDQATATVVGESRLRLGDRNLDGIRLGATAKLDGGRWEVTRLELTRARSALALQGVVIPGETPRVDLSATGTLMLEELGPLLSSGEDSKGALRVSGKILGDRLPPTFEGTLTLADAIVRRLPVTRAQASLSIRPDKIEMIELHGQVGGGGTLSASGIYAPGDARYEGRMTLEEVSLEEAFRAIGWPWPLAGKVTGSVEGSGQPREMQALSLRLDLSARGLRAKDGTREADTRLSGTAEGGILKIQRLTLGGRDGQAFVRGVLNLSTEALALGVWGRISDLAHGLWPWAVEGVSGQLSFSGTIGGTLKAPAFSGRVRGQTLSVKAVRLGSVEGPVEVERGRIASRGLTLAVGRSVGLLAGEAKLPPLPHATGNWQERLTLALKLDAKGRVEDVSAWLPRSVPLGGPFILQLIANGTPKRLTGSSRMEVRELRVGAERLESLHASIGFEGSGLAVRSLTGRFRGIAFRAEGQLGLSGSYRFTLTPVTLNLATLPLAPGLGGTALLSARGAGELSTPQMEGELALTDTAFRDMRVGDGRLQFSLNRSQWRWELQLDSGVRARGTAPLALDRPIEVEVVATDVDLTPYLRALRQRLPFPLMVRADGSARLIVAPSNLGNLSGSIELTALRCQAAATPCQLRAPTGVAVEAGSVRFDSLDLVGPGLSVTVKGKVRPGERTDLELTGHAPFPLVEPWVPAVAGIRGTPAVRVSLVGPPEKLRVDGRAELRGVEVKLKPVPVWLSVAAGEVTFDNDRVEYILHRGAAAAGKLQGRGASERRGERWHHTVELSLDKATIEQFYDQLEIGSRWASGDLRLRGSFRFETGLRLEPLRTLAGSLSAALEGGSLSRYPALVRIFGLLGSPAQPVRLPDLAQERMPYRRISADFTVAQGVMETKSLVLDSEVLRVSGVGKIRLPEKTIDFDLGVRPLAVLEGGIRKVPVLGRLLPEEQGLTVIYFDVEGPWDDPKASVAPVKSLSQTVVDLLLFLLRAPDRLLVPQEQR